MAADDSSNQDPVKEFGALMEKWHSQQGSAASPVPILTRSVNGGVEG